MTNENVSFNMVRPDMENIPVYALPPGYHFRHYRAGDDLTWLVLQRATEPFIAMGDDYFFGQFGADLDALPDRMFFVESAEGEVVGTITAWWEKERHNPQERGRIHWVAVHPDQQRRGLSKPMMTYTMQRLAQDHPSVVLGTSSGRPWAVKVYLDFGFRPEPGELTEPDILAAWIQVQTLIEHPALASLPTP